MVLLGMVPVLTQAPPTISRCSMTATRRATLGALNRGPLSGRTGADDDEIEFLHVEPVTPAILSRPGYCIVASGGGQTIVFRGPSWFASASILTDDGNRSCPTRNYFTELKRDSISGQFTTFHQPPM